MFLETQEELLERAINPRWNFDYNYPVWQCPDCGLLNRNVNTFMEICGHCEADHTLDWVQYIINEEI